VDASETLQPDANVIRLGDPVAIREARLDLVAVQNKRAAEPHRDAEWGREERCARRRLSLIIRGENKWWAMRVQCTKVGPWKSNITCETRSGPQSGELYTVVGVSQFRGDDYYELAEWPSPVPEWPDTWHHSQFKPIGKEPDISVFTDILKRLSVRLPEPV
jgi:hypothetical protein